MRIDRTHIDPELRKLAGPMFLLNFLLSRKWGARLLLLSGRSARGRNIKGLHCEERYITSRSGGPDIRIRIYRPKQQQGELPAMLYCHGGGFLMGSPESHHTSIKGFMSKRPCVIVVPDYRKSTRFPFPAAFNDCYDTLLWVKHNALSLGIQDSPFMLAGQSAGGGLVAALSLRARDTQEVAIAFQMPLYPMIDDRQTTESSQFTGTPVWDARTNAYAWSQYLKGIDPAQGEIPVYAAPSRNREFEGLPPTISFVGSLEPFRDETLAYISALKEAKVPVEFKLYEACFHGFDQVAPHTKVGKDARDFTHDSFARYYDMYY